MHKEVLTDSPCPLLPFCGQVLKRATWRQTKMGHPWLPEDMDTFVSTRHHTSCCRWQIRSTDFSFWARKLKLAFAFWLIVTVTFKGILDCWTRGWGGQLIHFYLGSGRRKQLWRHACGRDHEQFSVAWEWDYSSIRVLGRSKIMSRPDLALHGELQAYVKWDAFLRKIDISLCVSVRHSSNAWDSCRMHET